MSVMDVKRELRDGILHRDFLVSGTRRLRGGGLLRLWGEVIVLNEMGEDIGRRLRVRKIL